MKRRKWIFVFSGFTFLLLIAYLGFFYNNKSVDLNLPEFENEACRRIYLGFYQKPKIDMRIVFGYKDARPARFVADRYERMIFIQRLTQECKRTNLACGFTRSLTDSDLLTRRINGPDGKPREILLRIVNSSAGADDEENRKNPFQKWKTRFANLTFLQGLTKADVVIYNGHSRAGGGPDFGPPQLTPNHEVDFSWYKAHEPGFSPILSTLESAPTETKLLGLYSCASSKHFLDRVRKVKPDLGLITSPKLIYFADAMESSLQAISSLLSLKCEGSFQNSLASRKSRASGAEVSGFFEP